MATVKTVYYYDNYSPTSEQVQINKPEENMIVELFDGAISCNLEDAWGSIVSYRAGAHLIQQGTYTLTVGNLSASPKKSARVVVTLN
jgi:hypothetical protein